METVDTLVTILVMGATAYFLREAFIKFFNWVNGFSSTSSGGENEVTSGINYE